MSRLTLDERARSAKAATCRCHLCRKRLGTVVRKAAIRADNGGNPDRPLCEDCALELAPEQDWSGGVPCDCCGRLVRELTRRVEKRSPSRFTACSPACREVAALRKEHEQRRLAPRPCAFCGIEFSPRRRDAKTCSNSCESKLWRRRRREKAPASRARSADKAPAGRCTRRTFGGVCGADFLPPDSEGDVFCLRGHLTPAVYRQAERLMRAAA